MAKVQFCLLVKNLFDKQYEKLNESYERTIYRCFHPLLNMYIGQMNPDADIWLKDMEFETLCILTAFNPESKIHTPTWNQQSQDQLVEELGNEGFEWKPGVNRDTGGRFPDELTCWVLGMTQEQGWHKGKRWSQNAFVFYQIGGRPELIWV